MCTANHAGKNLAGVKGFKRIFLENILYFSSDLTLPTDCLYTVGLRHYCLLAEPQSCFDFQHPNFEQLSNERDTMLEFQMSMPCEVSDHLSEILDKFKINLSKMELAVVEVFRKTVLCISKKIGILFEKFGIFC